MHNLAGLYVVAKVLSHGFWRLQDTRSVPRDDRKWKCETGHPQVNIPLNEAARNVIQEAFEFRQHDLPHLARTGLP